MATLLGFLKETGFKYKVEFRLGKRKPITIKTKSMIGSPFNGFENREGDVLSLQWLLGWSSDFEKWGCSGFKIVSVEISNFGKKQIVTLVSAPGEEFNYE